MDLQRLMTTIDLVALAGVSLKQKGRYHIGPCPFCGGDDRFTIKHTDDGDLWICRHCSPGKYQDGIALVMKLHGLDFVGALGVLGEGKMSLPIVRPIEETRPQPLDCPPDEDWQTPVLLACADAAYYLQGKTTAAAAVYNYLIEKRGLTPDIIFNHMLGFNPEWRQIEGKYWMAPGITIPAMVEGQLWYAQVRTTAKARQRGRDLGKYQAVSGSRLKALFRANTLLGVHTAIVTEGEFDAMLLARFLPDGVAVVTMGSARTIPGIAFQKYFAPLNRLLLALDNDEAGAEGLEDWRTLLKWTELMPSLPDGLKDISDFWRAGGNLRAWIQSGLDSQTRFSRHEG
ncbi:MAG: toprim domain-containing protein [Chloroflexi bacterium]|nr:toprim domain-containing protein [Chloroflexota bacterium]